MSDVRKKCWASFNLGTPAIYQIVLHGHLHEDWEEDFDLAVSHLASQDDISLTLLTGLIVDQAALFGILNSLYGLGFPLLSVKIQSIDPTEQPPITTPYV